MNLRNTHKLPGMLRLFTAVLIILMLPQLQVSYALNGQREICGNGIDDNGNGVVDENNSLDFDGSDDYVQVNNSAAMNLTTALTIEAWVKPTNYAGSDSRTIVMKGVYGWGLSLEGADGTTQNGKL